MAPEPAIEQILAARWRCPTCRADLAPLTKICPSCRTRFRLPQEIWYHDRKMVFLMMFLVAGPLAIPWLVKSPKFTPAAKLFWSITVSLYTGLLVWGVWLIVKLAWDKIAGVIR